MRFTFKDKQEFNGIFNTGKVIHKIEKVTRVDNEDNSEMAIIQTICGQSSSSYRRELYSVSKKEVTCKKCLKRL